MKENKKQELNEDELLQVSGGVGGDRIANTGKFEGIGGNANLETQPGMPGKKTETRCINPIGNGDIDMEKSIDAGFPKK